MAHLCVIAAPHCRSIFKQPYAMAVGSHKVSTTPCKHKVSTTQEADSLPNMLDFLYIRMSRGVPVYLALVACATPCRAIC